MPEKFESFNNDFENEADKEDWEDLMGNELEQFLNDIEARGHIAWWSDVTEGREGFERLNNISNEFEEAKEDHAEFLDKSGLDIDLRESHYKSRNEPEKDSEEEKNPQIIVNVVDRKKFVEYLESFGVDEKLDKKEESSLDKLASVLSVQVPDYYELSASDNDFLTLAATFKELSDQYNKFSKMPGGEGLKDWAEVFSEYREATSGKYLRELLEIKELDFEYYLRSGIGRFHMFNVEIFKSVWDDILITIGKCAKNKNAHKYLKALVNDIDSELSSVQGELEKKEEKTEYIPKIKSVRKRLEEIDLS